MNNLQQKFVQYCTKAAIVTLIMGFGVTAKASVLERFKEGTHYQVLDKPIKPKDSKKIEVVEVFSYLCPHCYRLEPAVKKWKKTLGDDVVLIRKHAQFNRQYLAYAKLHVAVQLLNIEDQVDRDIFKSVHEKQAFKFEPEEQFDLVANAGVDKSRFLKTFDSFTHKTRLKQVEKEMLAYKVTGVPAMIVNGKYRASVSSAGSEQNLFDLMDYLIEIERDALKTASVTSSN